MVLIIDEFELYDMYYTVVGKGLVHRAEETEEHYLRDEVDTGGSGDDNGHPDFTDDDSAITGKTAIVIREDIRVKFDTKDGVGSFLNQHFV